MGGERRDGDEEGKDVASDLLGSWGERQKLKELCSCGGRELWA